MTAWDNFVQAERDRVAVAEVRKWEKRRQQALESNWETAQLLRDKLKKMLAWPIQRQISQDGKTIIEPARWSFQTATLIAKSVAEIEVAVLTAAGADTDELTDAQARAYAEIENQEQAEESENQQ